MPRSKKITDAGIANRGPVKLDKGTFGGTKACHYLVDMLNEHNDHRLAASVVSAFNSYFSGMGELIKLDNPHRDTMMKMWLVRAQDMAKSMWANHGVDPTIFTASQGVGSATLVSLFDNVLHHRYRQASEHGLLIEKFRDKDMEHAEVLQALRNLAKYEKEKYAEPI